MSTTPATPPHLAAPYVSHVAGETSPRLERGPDQSYTGPAVRVDLAGYGGAFWLGYTGGTMAEDPDAYAAHLIACANAAPALARACDPETLEAIAAELEGFQHSARADSLRVLARAQREALAKLEGQT